MDAFSSNDPLPPGPLPYADITNPQSLNKYTYTHGKRDAGICLVSPLVTR